jgi:hypothetical protein
VRYVHHAPFTNFRASGETADKFWNRDGVSCPVSNRGAPPPMLPAGGSGPTVCRQSKKKRREKIGACAV